MRISDWSSDVCSSDLLLPCQGERLRSKSGIVDRHGAGKTQRFHRRSEPFNAFPGKKRFQRRDFCLYFRLGRGRPPDSQTGAPARGEAQRNTATRNILKRPKRVGCPKGTEDPTVRKELGLTCRNRGATH